MALIYITGPNASGKTTVRNLLRERGYEAHDTDEDDITRHTSRKTGKQIEYPSDPNERTPEWYADHAFNMVPERIAQMSRDAKDRPIFLCGAATNDLELAHYFDKIICLVIDQDIAKERLAIRTTNTFGKDADEASQALKYHESIIEKYRNVDASMVDASRPTGEVIDDILALVKQPTV